MTEQEAVELARKTFITEENTYGCAETTLLVLQQAFGLPGATDSSPAMALNGGLAWSGGPCGALSGAALAVGRLAGQRIADHKEAKAAARSVIARLMAEFRAEFGHTECRDLVGLDISTAEGHAAFIESQVWHTVCMAQIAFVLGKLVALGDQLPPSPTDLRSAPSPPEGRGSSTPPLGEGPGEGENGAQRATSPLTPALSPRGEREVSPER
jgi:C_GCAxxG_C_C family probable redox protein